MKKRVLSVAALLVGSFAVNAQVGVGTLNPNKSAELTIESSNRGLLIPRIALKSSKDVITITEFPKNGINSMLVYNTATIEKDLKPGFYYWYIDSWNRLTTVNDIPEAVINNYQQIFKNENIKNEISNIVNTTKGNVVYEGDKLYYINDNGQREEILERLTKITFDEPTGDYIYYSEKDIDRKGNIIGEGTRIKIKETVIKKFGDIINNKTVKDLITNYLSKTYVGGNVYYDGNSFTYVTKEGEVKNITFNEIVKANETVTTLVDNKNGTFTYTNEKGEVVTIDLTKGPKGDKGEDGKSALEIWQGLPGNDGKDGEAFIASLKGDKGDKGDTGFKSESQPGKSGEPGKPGEVGGPGEGVTIVHNDSGVWVYDPTTNTWTNILGPKGDKGDKGDTGFKSESQPGKSGEPGKPGEAGGPGEGVTIVHNDSGVWVYDPTTNTWTNILGPKGDKGDKGDTGFKSESQPGKSGEPGKPGEPGGPGEGVTIVHNDSGVWVYDPTTNTWTNILGPKGDKGDKGDTGFKSESQPGKSGEPGKPGEPGGPGEGVTIVHNDSGVWVYDPTTNTWTNILGPKGDKGDKGDTGFKSESQPGKSGEPGKPGEPGGPGEGVTIVHNDSGVWVYDPTTNTWTNILGPKGDKGDKGDTGFKSESQPGKSGEPGKPGEPGGPGEGVTIVHNDEGVWVYDPTTNTWTNILGPKGDKGADGKSVTITNNPDGSSTITDGAGGTVTVKNGVDGQDGKSVTITNNLDGSSTITDGAGGTVTVKNGVDGAKGDKGEDGKSVTITNNPDGSSTITDGAGGTVTVKNGVDGQDGKSVTITNNPDGSSTITDGAGGTVTVKNGVDGAKGDKGEDGKSVTITNNPDGSSTITDGAGGTVTVKNGVDGAKGDKGEDGKSVTITNNPDGSSTITDGAGGTVTVKNGVDGAKGDKGEDGKSVTITNNPDGSSTITDGAGGTVTVKNGVDGKDGIGGKTTAGHAITITGLGTEASPYVVNANETELILSGDVTGPANANKLTTLKGKPVNQTSPTANGQALVYNGTEWVAGTPSIDVTNVLNAKNLKAADTEPTIEVTEGGTGAVLVETSLRVKDESITSGKIKNGTIQPIDMANGGIDKVLITDGSGNPKWEDKSKVGEVITADNGLTKTGTKVQLGGDLLKATEIVTTSVNTLALKGLDKKNVQNEQTQRLMAVDNNGDIIKGLKAAMPKFFYMPSIIIPTSEEQLSAPGSGHLANDTFSDATLQGSINLYERYKKQFGSPVTSNLGKNTTLPVLPQSELDYHITWYDTSVFKVVTVSDSGILNYELQSGADVTVGTFMNIVFAVRNDN